MICNTRLKILLAMGAMVLLWVSGCGGRTFTGAGNASQNQNNSNNTNQNTNENSNTNWNNNVNTNTNGNSGECLTDDDCVVARKWDECCSCNVSASQKDLDADDCLIPLEQSAVPDHCIVECPAIPCTNDCPPNGWNPTCRQGVCEWEQGRCSEDEECVTALPVDNCCLFAFPATHADIDADPCLIYWAPWSYDIAEECLEQWDPECAYLDCAPSGPQSRAVECSDLGCNYIPECESMEDCELLLDGRQCCPCPEAWPVSMVDHDPCLVYPGESIPQDCIPEGCENILCEPCYGDAIADCQGSCLTLYPAYQ